MIAPPEIARGMGVGGFNMVRLVDEGTGKVVVEYKPNAKQYFAHTCNADEILYGGSVFGGKTWFLLWHTAMHCLKHGRTANTVYFRRTYKRLEASVIPEVLSLWHGKLGTYKSGDHVFEWKNGAKTTFAHLEESKDVLNHQSAQYTLVCFDELTEFEQEMYAFMYLRLRSPKDASIHPQMLGGTNPLGIGHQWVAERFGIGKSEPYKLYKFEHHQDPDDPESPLVSFTRAFIPASVEDNQEGLARDPTYRARMKQNLTDSQYQAYVRGDWTLYEGRAFPDWNPQVHVCKPFIIPPGWKVLRAYDHGYTSPHCYGRIAQHPTEQTRYLVDEWYGARPGTNQGVQMAIQDVRREIVDREIAAWAAGKCPMPWYGVAGHEMWNRTGTGTTPGTELNRGGVLFRATPAEPGSRLAGKQLVHSLLRINPETGKPGLVVFDTCPETIQEMSTLVLDDKKPEDVDTAARDHAYDMLRMAVRELSDAPALPPWVQDRDGQVDMRMRLPMMI
jgi:hypothetical protein